jgi:signal transduction histidine kinase/CheY-like chemotaxis protein/ABC-type amino acid transport substrate-binding protein
MRMPIRILCGILGIGLAAAMSAGCKESAGKSQPLPTASFRDAPGVTDDEIKAIDRLREQKSGFVYGMTPGEEAFYGKNGEIQGYAALFCDWLTGIFEIPFRPALFAWSDLLAGLEAGTIDFTGDLTATESRRKIYRMTDAIAMRPLKYIQITGSKPLEEIAQPKIAFLENSTTIESVTSALEPKNYEIVLIGDSSRAYDLLKSETADAYFFEGPEESVFDEYGDLTLYDFHPFVFSPVSLSTRNPELETVISIVQKILHHGNGRHGRYGNSRYGSSRNGIGHFLTVLYNRGYRDFLKYKLTMSLTGEELAYINSHPTVPFGAERDNYPISFYNARIGEWEGIAHDVLREIESLTGISFEVKNDRYAEWPDLQRMLVSGEVAAVSELLRSKEREGVFLWPSTPILTHYYALISKSDYPDININEINFIKTGLLKDTVQAAAFKNWFPNAEAVEYERVSAIFAALERGEIDMVMARQSRLLDLTNFRELTGYKANIVFNQPVESTFGININEPTLCAVIGKALHLIDTDKISRQWMQKTYDYQEKLVQLRRPLAAGIGFLLFCVLALLFLLFFRSRNEGKKLEKLVLNRTSELEKQHGLMRLINDTAALLLESEVKDYLNVLNRSMEIVCQFINVDRVYLWQNFRKENGKLYYKQVCKWTSAEAAMDSALLEFSYEDALPSWESLLSSGEVFNGPFDEIPEHEKATFSSYRLQSMLVVPLFIKNVFWGFVSFDDCRQRRVFSLAEIQLLRSWGLLAVGALERDQIANKMQETLIKLEAVISNYKGVIWSVDNDKTITSFNGQLLKSIGIEPSFLEGKTLEAARLKTVHLDIVENVEKTFLEGPQDWISEFGGKMYHSYTMPIYDSGGNLGGVVGSTDDVTETIRLQEELKTTLDFAKNASESKSRFLANMSHEMRTPLNAVIGLAETELINGNKEGDSLNTMEKIYTAGTNLLRIINDLLDISKIESGKFALIPVEYDVASMINDIANFNVIRIGSKPIQLQLHVSGSLPSRLEGDELRVKQIFNNLLSNAIKYTPSGYIEWTISCEREGNRVKIISSVKDTGIGISKEDQKKLFEEAYLKTDLKANHYVEGTGLGFPITQEMIRLMGGTIAVQSESRMGSTFTVEFYQNVITDEVIGDENAENLSHFRYAVHLHNLNRKLIRANMSYASVMVVDDVVTNLEVARGMLKPYKLKIDCVMSGIEAIKRIKEEAVRYDAVFMDHMMPEMDGIETVKRIRKDIGSEYAKNIPIIALTANALLGNDSMFLENGFQAFLSKPIDIIRLDQVLNAWVRDKKKEQALPPPDDEEAAESPSSIKTINVPGLNAQVGLARFGDEDTYLRVLRTYAAHTPDYIGIIKDPNSDIDSYRIAAHSIKGSGRGVGAEKLGDMAEKLEAAAKQKDEAYIKANNGEFIETAEKLIADLVEFIKTLPEDFGDAEKPEKDAPDPEILAALRQAANDYDITALQDAIEKLNAFRYRSQPDLVKRLREYASVSDFVGILKQMNNETNEQ